MFNYRAKVDKHTWRFFLVTVALLYVWSFNNSTKWNANFIDLQGSSRAAIYRAMQSGFIL